MANTYSQIALHIVFAVKNREAMLRDEWRDELFAYIGGIIKNKQQMPLCIGGWRDHIHILLGCRPSINVAELVKDIKLATNKWVNAHYKCRFAWQDGYGIFSISRSHEQPLIEYIKRQPTHHLRESMIDEYRRLLTINGVNYDERYIFREPE